MSKLTPGISRLAAVLELFIDDPAKPWTLSEIVKRLDISRSTCHALLVSLDEAKLVYRDERKRYTLGTLAVAVGYAASRHYSTADLMRRELTVLSHDLGAIAVTNYRRDDGILIRDWIDPMPEGRSSRAGQVIPLSPPWGAIFYAWESVDAQRRWLANMEGQSLNPARREYMERGLSKTREQGFLCGIYRQDEDLEYLDMDWRSRLSHTDHFVNEINPGEIYMPSFFAAPVFRTQEEPLFAVALTGFYAPMKGAEILDIAHRLQQCCRKLGHFASYA